ncbi:MAG: hypothetical protein AAF614_10025 [Chloroflexota bacterium]
METLNTFSTGFVAGMGALLATFGLYVWLKQYFENLFDFDDMAKNIYFGERPE